ncbi:hypothetical protein LDENG_00023690 [Lucifuga dentata]|nr:hypothetical protein LDENG_00023690 [Lucifuga dentata]
MSKEENRAAVFRTTKVMTKLKQDGSWLQRRNEPEVETKQEKPWLAEVRAARLNEAARETSPFSSALKPTPEPTKPAPERAQSSGFLIRGVFTKTDSKPVPSSTSTSVGVSRTTNYSKNDSESYRKIAPHTVRPTSENQESQLSLEEQEKRREAASNVLKKSAVRQRSYVLSAAKKYESKEKELNTSPVSPSFVAKRVEITDDNEKAVTPAPPPSAPAVPATSVTDPEPKSQSTINTLDKTAVDVAVEEPVAPKVEDTAPEPVKEAPSLVSVTEKQPSEDMKPGCTKVATPLPELVPEYVKEVCGDQEPDNSGASQEENTLLVEIVQESPTPEPAAPASPTLVSPTPESAAPVSPTQVSPTPESAAPVSPTPEPAAPVSPTQVSPTPEPAAPASPTLVSPTPDTPDTPDTADPVSPTVVSSTPESAATEDRVKAEPEPGLSPTISSNVDTLAALSETLVCFDTSSISQLNAQAEKHDFDVTASVPNSFTDDEPVLAKGADGTVDSQLEEGVEHEPTPALSNCEAITDDLLALNDGPAESAEPVPPSPGRWSQDLLGLDSPAKTSVVVDLLADDVIPINTEARSLSTEREEEKQTDETARETQSSADPFDPYPIGTTSSNSSSDLLQPLSAISINSESHTSLEDKDSDPAIIMSGSALESLADDVIPINTDTKSLSTQRSWAHSWETSTPQLTESQEAEPKSCTEDQQTLVWFERKSTDNDSPWDRWMSPTIYNVTMTTTEEEEEERPEDTETQEVTSITTIRETYSEPQPAMDRSETFSRTLREDNQRVQTPEPETKKNFVYVKQYVSTSELSLHNVRDSAESGSEYLTSTSTNYSYSSPSTYSSGSLSSTCTYCGELVGNDAKITIEHLNINCHCDCFKCGVCNKPMGDVLYNMFLHGGKVHCESCYSKALN